MPGMPAPILLLGGGTPPPGGGTVTYLDNFDQGVPNAAENDETGNFSYTSSPWILNEDDPKFGLSNAQGPGGFETVGDQALLNIRDDNVDFTLETWLKFRPGSSPFGGDAGVHAIGAGNGPQLRFLSVQPGGDPDAPRELRLKALPVQGGAECEIANVNPLVQDTWNHIAVTRESTLVRFFINGLMQGSQIWTGYDWGISNNWDLDWDDIGFTQASVDGARFILGQAKYTANFPVPVAPPTLDPND